VITEKHRFMLFGTYPYEEHWRPLLVCVLFVVLYVVSAMRRFWRWELALFWVFMLTLIGVLMWGGVLGLSHVPQERWGGLPITLILSTFGWPSPSRSPSWWRWAGAPSCRRSRRSACSTSS
jgi:general L-amino acid transport system permease protein